MEDINTTAELYISSKQYSKTLEVIGVFFPAIILENETLEEATSEENKGCSYLQKYRRRGGHKERREDLQLSL